MKFGVREICDVVLKRKAGGYFGNLYLEKGAPVLYFDTLKTSSLEGQATTVYAQGGKGNPRLVAWEGDRVVTFTMEDALISPESFSILSGAGLIDATETDKIYVHATEQVEVDEQGMINLEKIPANIKESEMYIMLMTENGAIDTSKYPMKIPAASIGQNMKAVDVIKAWANKVNAETDAETGLVNRYHELGITVEEADYAIAAGDVVFVDYYVEADSKVKQINIEAGKFGGSYYLEASTLFRDQATGEDYPAEFIIPNCKVQSNFTFTMAPTGDPSTFTFTLDAFPDYTKFDRTKKVIAAVQIVEDIATFGKKGNV
jgi:hypothetical protein